MEHEPDQRIIQLEAFRRRRRRRQSQLPHEGKVDIEFAAMGMIAAIGHDDIEQSTLPHWLKEDIRKIFPQTEDAVLLEGVDTRNNSVCIVIPRRVHAGLYRLLSDDNNRQNFIQNSFPEQEDIP